MKIYHAQGWSDYSNWLQGATIVKNLKDADLLFLEGGTDVSSDRYGEPRNQHAEHPDNHRDEVESKLFKEAVALGIPIIGVCRGSQFCCVMNHGRLVQHQQNKYHRHPITTSDGREVVITSAHHQAQFPYDMPDTNYKLLAWTEGLSAYHQNGKGEEISEKPFKEAEIVYYPKTRALGIQGHPEWMSREQYPDTFKYLDSLVEGLMNNTL